MNDDPLFNAVDAAQEIRRLRRVLADEGVPDNDLQGVDALLSTTLENIEGYEAQQRLVKAACKVAAVAMKHDEQMIADDALDTARSAAIAAAAE